MKNLILKTLLLAFVISTAFSGMIKAQWMEQKSGTSNGLISISVPSHNVAWAAGSNGTILFTNDNGNHWRNISIAAAADIWSIYALDHKTAFALGFKNDWSEVAVFRTANSGQSWQIVLSLPTNHFFDAMTFFNDKEGILYGDPDYNNPVPNYWDIYKTYDGGLTWSAIATPPEQLGLNYGWKNAMTCVGNTVFFGTTLFDNNWNFGPDARIYRSTDKGETWSYSTTPGVVQVNTIHFINAMTGYGCRAKTTNGGLTWFAMNDPYATMSGDINNFILSATGFGNEVWVTGIHRDGPSYFGDPWNNYTTVYYSSNGGMNWALDYTAPSGTPNEVRISRKLSDTRSLFLIRDDGGIAFRRITTSEQLGPSNAKNFKLFENYPNPFNPTTNIKFQIQSSSLVTLKVFDILGKEVTTLINEFMQPGIYDVRFDGNNLSSGTYFYKLIAGDFIDCKRMLLIK